MNTSLRTILTASALLMFTTGTAYAFPPWAGDSGQYNVQNSCSSGCHDSTGGGTDRANALEVTGEGLLDLDASRNDGNSRGPIPFFTAQPGDTIALTMNVLDGTDLYAVQLKRLEKAGVLGPAGSDLLAGYGGDATWVEQTSNPGAPVPNYFTTVSFLPGTTWTSGPVAYSFDLTLAATTPLNTYDLEFAVAGRLNQGGGAIRTRFYGDQHFYLSVVPEPTSIVLLSLGLTTLGVVTTRGRHRQEQ